MEVSPKILLHFAVMYNLFNCSRVLRNLHSYNGLEAIPQRDKDSFRNDHVKPLLLGQLLCATSACCALYTNDSSVLGLTVLLEYGVYSRFQNYITISNEVVEKGFAKEVDMNRERERIRSKVHNI